MMDTTLAKRMRQRAEADGLPDDHELRWKADDFDKAVAGHYAERQTHSVAMLLGAWSRARRAWCDYTGEPLV